MSSSELLELLGKSTIVMSDYHLCRYDAILGVLICVGDDADVLVLGKDMCRVVLPTPHGVHWLDCFVFAGTSTFVLLCNEMLLCMDYRMHDARSILKNDYIDDSNTNSSLHKVCFTCIHVPQGMTCGAVGCSDGKVRFFRFVQQGGNSNSESNAVITNTSQANTSMSNLSVNDVSKNASSNNNGDNNRRTLPHSECAILAWTTKQVNIPLLCQPFHLSASSSSSSSTSAMRSTNQSVYSANSLADSGRFLHMASVLCLDSYPENPNTFIAIVAGVSGVCKWYVEDERISCFFDASSIKHLPDPLPVVCKVTPGGTYVAAVTMHCTRILLWSEAKKKKNKCSEIYWMIDLSHIIALPHLTLSSPQQLGNTTNKDKTGSTVAPCEAWELQVNEPFWYNEYRVGIQMARTALEHSFHATNDRHSQLYILVHGQHEIVEVVVRVDDKSIWRCEPLVAELNAFTAYHSKQHDNTSSSTATIASTSSLSNKNYEHSQAAHNTVTRSNEEMYKDSNINKSKNSASSDTISTEQELTKDMVSNYFNVFHVEPCVLSNYWHNAWTDIDLEILIVTSLDGLRPLLAQRNRKGGGIERITELRELPQEEAWRTHTQLLRLPGKQLWELASLHYPNMTQSQDNNRNSNNNYSVTNYNNNSSSSVNTLHRLLRGGDPLLRYCASNNDNNITSSITNAFNNMTCNHDNKDKAVSTPICNEVFIATVTDKHEAVALAPKHNEIIPLQSSLLKECVPWSTLAFGEDTSQSLILQQALPLCNACDSVQTSELLLRVFATHDLLTVMKIDLRRRSGGVILNLDCNSLHLSKQTREETCMVKQATLLQASLEDSSVTSNMCVRPYGTSLLLLLCDSSVVMIDLSYGLDQHTGLPTMLFMPAALLPVNSIATSLTYFWLPISENRCGSFCLAYLFAEGKGVLLWNVSSMRMIHYSCPSYALHASEIQIMDTVPFKPCNLTGDVHEFTIICHNTTLTAPTQAGVYGVISLHDALGVCLFSCTLGYGMGHASTVESSWCISTSTRTKAISSHNKRNLSESETEEESEEPNAWVALPLALSNTSALCYHFNIDTESRSNSIVLTWSIGSLSAAVHSETVTLNATVVEARAEWGRGVVELLYSDENNEMVSCPLNDLPYSQQEEQQESSLAQQMSTLKAKNNTNNVMDGQSNEPTLAFISKHELVLIALHSLLPSQLLTTTTSYLSYAAQTAKGSAQASCKLDHTRRIECVMECKLWEALLIITCDNNGWRWINFLHSYSAEPIMTAQATLDFVGDDQVNVIAFTMETVLHVYLLGTDSGTIGHFYFVKSNCGSDNNSKKTINLVNIQSSNENLHANAIIEHNCFGGPTFHALPCTFRGYGRFLPPQPTMKEETGFFKRLMTLPWEDVVLQMESVTLRQVRKVGEVYRGSEQVREEQHELQQYLSLLQTKETSVNDKPKVDTAKSIESSRDKTLSNNDYLLQGEENNSAISATKTNRVQEVVGANNKENERFTSNSNADVQRRKNTINNYNNKYKTPEVNIASSLSSPETQPGAGSRYAQLKAIAEREHVSLTEARRMMSENVRKLQERGEKIGAIQNKSSELAQQALTFQELARQLKEKKRNSWL